MEKLVLLADDLDAARAAIVTLRNHGIADTHLSVIARDDVETQDLPAPEIEDKSDLVPALERGVAAGGSLGLLAGLTALVFPPAGLTIGGAGVLVSAVGGATFGAWASAMIGVSVDNSQLREFEDEVASGKLLIVAHVDENESASIRQGPLASTDGVVLKGPVDEVPPVI